jgi:hypothetical protein
MIHHSRATTVTVEAGRFSKADRGDVVTLLYNMNAYAEENARFRLDVDLVYAEGEGI